MAQLVLLGVARQPKQPVLPMRWPGQVEQLGHQGQPTLLLPLAALEVVPPVKLPAQELDVQKGPQLSADLVEAVGRRCHLRCRPLRMRPLLRQAGLTPDMAEQHRLELVLVEFPSRIKISLTCDGIVIVGSGTAAGKKLGHHSSVWPGPSLSRKTEEDVIPGQAL